jgi:hypothetical protein
MITIREISDNNTSISSTRWAFATVIKFDVVVILLSITAFIICHIIKKPLDNSFFYSVGTLLGILTTLVATPKALQGFEPKKKEESSKTTTDENNNSEIKSEGK